MYLYPVDYVQSSLNDLMRLQVPMEAITEWHVPVTPPTCVPDKGLHLSSMTARDYFFPLDKRRVVL